MQFLSHVQVSPNRRYSLGAVGLLLCMAALGCVHLLSRSHYPVVNYDGFYFHFIARQIMDGTGIPYIGSGLAYPMAFLGHVVGLDVASSMISPLLGILTGLVLYFGVSRLYSPKLGFLAVVCFVFAQIPRIFYLSGNLDRDGLHLLLMTAGILGLGLYFKTHRMAYLGATFGTILLLTWEWGTFALLQYVPALLLLMLFMDSYRFESLLFWVGTMFLVGGFFLAGRLVMEWSVFQGTSIVELEPLNTMTVIQYATLAVPLVFGFRRSDNFVVGWFLAFILMGFFASRLSVYAAAPACIIGAHGLEALWEKRSEWRYVFVAGCVIFLGLSWMVPQNMSMSRDWHDALVWVGEDSTSQDEIAAWWSYGWWVMDISDRTPVATQATDEKVDALAALYFAPSVGAAQSFINTYGWDYVVMSTREEHFMDAIRSYLGGTPETPYFYQEVMAGRVEAAYRNGTVVVLKSPVPS